MAPNDLTVSVVTTMCEGLPSGDPGNPVYINHPVAPVLIGPGLFVIRQDSGVTGLRAATLNRRYRGAERMSFAIGHSNLRRLVYTFFSIIREEHP
jgi:hypothetical protein